MRAEVNIRHKKSSIYTTTIQVKTLDEAKEWGRRQAKSMGVEGAYIQATEAKEKEKLRPAKEAGPKKKNAKKKSS